MIHVLCTGRLLKSSQSIPLGSLLRSFWKNSRKVSPCGVAGKSAMKSSPWYFRFMALRGCLKSRRVGSSKSGSIWLESQQASSSFGFALSLMKLPLTQMVWHPAWLRFWAAVYKPFIRRIRCVVVLYRFSSSSQVQECSPCGRLPFWSKGGITRTTLLLFSFKMSRVGNESRYNTNRNHHSLERNQPKLERVGSR